MHGSSWMQHVLLCRSLVSLCFSSQHFVEVGVLVSMVLVLTLLLCSSFFSVYSENSEQGAQRRARVRVSLNALTAVQVPVTRILDSSWMQHADASTCCSSWRVRTTWPWEMLLA